MATLATAVAEVRTGGSATNGGGYDPGIAGAGSDYSQQNAAQLAVTDGAITAGTATLTSATGGFTSAMIGNAVYISSDPTLWFFITAVASSNSCTVDKNAVTGGTGLTVNVGGAFAKLPDVLGSTAKAIPGNTIFWKSGTYTLTSTWTLSTVGTASGPVRIVGYDTTRSFGNTDTGPVITSSTNSVDLFTLTGSSGTTFNLYNFTASHTAGTRGRCFNVQGNGSTSRVITIQRFVADGFSKFVDGTAGFNPSTTIKCSAGEIKNCTTNAFDYSGASTGTPGTFYECTACYIHDNTGVVFNIKDQGTNGVKLRNCIFDTNSSNIILSPASNTPNIELDIEGCTFYGGGGTVILNANTSNDETVFYRNVNNIYYSNSGYAISLGVSQNNILSKLWENWGNAYGSNSSGNFSNFPAGSDDIALTADPFTNAAGGNFSLNNTAGGDAAIRAKAYPLTLAGQTNYRDIGALQHQDSGGSGYPAPLVGSGLVY